MAYKNKAINIHAIEYYNTVKPYVNLVKCVSPWATLKSHDVFESDEFGFISSIDQGGTSTSTVTIRCYVNDRDGSGGVFTGDYILSCIGYPGTPFKRVFWPTNVDAPETGNNQHGTWVYDTANGRNHFSALIPLSALEDASTSRVLQLQTSRINGKYWDGTGPTSAGNYPREYAFFRKADETLQRTGEKFRPEFYSGLSNAAVIRTMPMQQQRQTEITNWESRPRESFFTQASFSGGPCLEDLVELANKAGTDFWWSVPTSATGDYITNAATYIANNLTSGKKLYFEWGNEPWNGIFPQNTFCQSMGLAKYDTGDPFENGLKFYGFSSVMVWDYVEAAWTAVRGNDTDLVRILNTQVGNTWPGKKMLETHYPDGQTVTQVSSFVDAMAVAPYFGGSFGTATVPTYDPTGVDDGVTASSLDQIYTRINAATETPEGTEETASGTNWSLLDAKANMQLCKDYFVTDLGLRLLAYEGGHHLAGATAGLQNNADLTAKFQAFVADPRIYDAYIQNYADWDSVVDDVFCAFHYIGAHWDWTLWGMRESDSQAQTLEAAPMYKAWLDWAGDDPPTPPPDAPATRQDYAWRPANFGSVFKDSPSFQREFGVMGASSILIPADTNAHEIVAAASSVGVSATHYLWGVSYCTSGTDSHAGIITDSESNNIAFVSARQEGPTFLSFKGPVKLPANGGLTFTKTSNAQVSWITPYISTVYRKYDSDD